MKNFLNRLLYATGFVILLGVVLLLYYNHKTACPGVAIYYKCNNLFD